MNLLNEIVKNENAYYDRVAQIAEQIDIWMEDISKEKRLGLKPMDQLVAETSDPYNRPAGGVRPSDTIEFKPTHTFGVEKPQPELPEPGNVGASRIHLIYNPKTGEIEKTLKTPMLSRPPAEYMEATAEQITGALKHLEKMNPKLADLLVHGHMSVWIPRTAAKASPSSVKHLGLNTNPNIESHGNTNIRKMSPEDLEAAHRAASKMKVAR